MRPPVRLRAEGHGTLGAFKNVSRQRARWLLLDDSSTGAMLLGARFTQHA
jgi:hypothetical protein